MLPRFIESLIKRRATTHEAQSEVDDKARPGTSADSAQLASDVGIIRRVTTFWYDAIRFVPLDDLLKAHAKAPELTFDQAALGQVPKSTGAKDRDDNGDDDNGREVVVVVGLAPRDWPRLRGQSARARFLLAIPATLTETGHLLPKGPDHLPFFNPTFIQSNDQRNDIFITMVDTVQVWQDEHPLPAIQEWPLLWSYAQDMLIGAVMKPAADMQAALEEYPKYLGLTYKCDWIVKILPVSTTNEAVARVESLYQYLLDPDEQTGGDISTYHRLITGFSGVDALRGDAASCADSEACGHIDTFKAPADGSSPSRQTRDIFPLDPSQRQAVRHACRLAEGEILAVNGPPGTGKTSTLRAIIGSYWVRAALTADRPPIIVGCGATNQAVTNITEAFLDAPHHTDDYILAQRWNPFVGPYGMYFASDTFAENNPDKIRKYQGFQRSTKTKDRCLFLLREARNPFSPGELNELTEFYLRKAEACSDIKATDVAGIIAELRALLRVVAVDLPNHLRRLMARAVTGSACDPLADAQVQVGILPLIQRQNDFVQRNIFITFVKYLRDPSARHLETVMTDAACDEAEAARLLVESVIDVSLRPHAFHIAARYWEGRFIEAASVRLYARSEENLRDALQRVCMLAPCIVSTVNTLPRLFGIDDPDPNKPRHFMYGVADLLIMDESGQALPELGAACFALTKRAVVVGDLKQLEPVSTIQQQNEITLLTSRNAVSDYIYLVDTFKAPSVGSVLAMAQLASSYHDNFRNGLTLLFHYRCVQPIIAYCNRLCYGGHLKAKTGKGADQWPPPLAWVEIKENASRRGGSWVNELEAREIAGWLRSAWPRLCADAGQKASIAATVAVLSPFRPQIEALRKAIGEAFEQKPIGLPSELNWPTPGEIQDMTIGTVHSLQGAERPIVLFSGAVSAENTAAAFFDSSPSILNVAVSRAKKSFVYFGHPHHLFRHDRDGVLNSGKPSAILGDHMRGEPLARRLYPLYLVIVEAPGKSRAIAEILGKDYRIFATGGSIREIDDGDLGLGLDRGLRPRWRWREGPGKPSFDDFVALARELSSYEAVYIATDADMEGEAIAWHVTDVLASIAGPHVWDKIRRVKLGDVTHEALTRAFAAPGVIDRSIASAAIARAIADRLIASRLAAETNRQPTVSEAEGEASINAALRQVAVPGKRASSTHYHPGRVQAGILRLICDATQSNIKNIARKGRFQITAQAALGERKLRGHLVLPEREFRIDAADPEAARQRFQASVVAKLPPTLDGYEHDEIEQIDHGLRSPPFLSTIEIMRRAVRQGLMPWETMEALQNLYLGQIMKHGYLGESED